ncbi:MAG TPA: hypothetical protein VN372_05290 [Methanospirillum sp.]|nr:hypothetical protein [Methanospirillum sp.]
MITASMQGESLMIDGHLQVVGTDLIDLMVLGRPVPVFSSGEFAGEAQHHGNLIHVTADGSKFVMGRRCIMGLLKGTGIAAIRVQPVPEGVAL